MIGKRVVLCASRKQEEMSKLIEKQGGIPLLRPAQGTVMSNEKELEKEIRFVIENEADWFVFTTGVGIEALLATAEKLDLKEPLLERLKSADVAVRGFKAASALKRVGVTPSVYSADGTTKGLITSLEQYEFGGKRVIVQLYGDTAPTLKEFFLRKDAIYTELMPYRHIPPNRDVLEQLYDEIVNKKVDAVCFTAAMQVRFLFAFVKESKDMASFQRSFHEHVVAAAVGKVTAEALREEGVERIIVPEIERMGAMIVELSRFFQSEASEKRL